MKVSDLEWRDNLKPHWQDATVSLGADIKLRVFKRLTTSRPPVQISTEIGNYLVSIGPSGRLYRRENLSIIELACLLADPKAFLPKNLHHYLGATDEGE